MTYYFANFPDSLTCSFTEVLIESVMKVNRNSLALGGAYFSV